MSSIESDWLSLSIRTWFSASKLLFSSCRAATCGREQQKEWNSKKTERRSRKKWLSGEIDRIRRGGGGQGREIKGEDRRIKGAGKERDGKDVKMKRNKLERNDSEKLSNFLSQTA